MKCWNFVRKAAKHAFSIYLQTIFGWTFENLMNSFLVLVCFSLALFEMFNTAETSLCIDIYDMVLFSQLLERWFKKFMQIKFLTEKKMLFFPKKYWNDRLTEQWTRPSIDKNSPYNAVQL